MHRFFVVVLLVALGFAPNALADNEPTYLFEFTAPGGNIGEEPGVYFFPLTMTPPNIPIIHPMGLELEITGLSYTNPGDLNIFLVDPFGTPLEIMDDRGDQVPISNVTLIFNDKGGDGVLPSDSEIFSGTYLSEEGPVSFERFTNGGTDSWLLVVIEDDKGQEDSGSFESYTLRVVPEPATLALLALGAAATLRRRR